MGDTITLGLLLAIRSDVAAIKAELVEIKERLGLLETGCSSLSRRVDCMGGDVERIRHRLDIPAAPVA